LSQALRAAPTAQEVGIVVMHGKGGSPGRFVNVLAEALEKEGFLVANLEMPWSKKRTYDVELDAAVGELTRALDALRARGAKKLFVSGHSQGGIFALLYGGRHKVDGVVAIVPGGAVDAKVYLNAIGNHVATARQMVADGRGQEKPSSPTTRARAAPAR
jgi:alpha-beta hydrolase superfamily lysophospholipase